MIVLIPKFRNEDEYRQFTSIAEDRDALCDNVMEYENAVHGCISEMEKAGNLVRREFINCADMVRWLSKNGHANIGKFRSVYYANVARDISLNEPLRDQ